jgi:hypothetical protein
MSKESAQAALGEFAEAVNTGNFDLFGGKHPESNQSMKPTAPEQTTASVFATTPCRGLSLSR